MMPSLLLLESKVIFVYVVKEIVYKISIILREEKSKFVNSFIFIYNLVDNLLILSILKKLNGLGLLTIGLDPLVKE